MAVYHDEIEIEDMEYDSEKEVFSYPCPCGDQFLISKEDLENGEDVATCPSCSLIIRVIYDIDSLPSNIKEKISSRKTLQAMKDIATLDSGTRVLVVTSSDEDYPAENILDGSKETFWVSTGLFPQEIVLALPGKCRVDKIRLHSYNIKDLAIEELSGPDPNDSASIQSLKLDHSEGRTEVTDVSVKGVVCSHLRLIILSGHSHFVCIKKLSVQGAME